MLNRLIHVLYAWHRRRPCPVCELTWRRIGYSVTTSASPTYKFWV